MSVWIRPRTVSKSKQNPRGRTFIVCYRLPGGRSSKIQYAGTFKTKTEADLRRDIIAAELAVGRDPQHWLASLKAPAAPRLKTLFGELFDEWLASKRKLSEGSKQTYKSHRTRICAALGGVDVRKAEWPTVLRTWLVDDLIAGEGPYGGPLSPSTIANYMVTVGQVLQYAGVEPDPTKKLDLPAIEDKEIRVVDRLEFHATLEFISDEVRVLFFRILEATGLRISETLAVRWRDIDWERSRMLLPSRITKTNEAHFAHLPAPLLERLKAMQPDGVDERRSVFVSLGIPSAGAARGTWARAAFKTGLTDITPHTLRHRRASLWVYQGVPPREIQYRLGHKTLEEHQETYSHVIVNERDDDWYECRNTRLGMLVA